MVTTSAVGASGAVFGLFGILLAAGRLHHPVDPQSRGVVGQLMFLVILNIVFGFASGGSIDNAAHLGGLAAGLLLGALIPPTGVPTMSSLWHKPGEKRAAVGRASAPGYMVAIGLAVVGVVVVAGIAFGTGQRVGVGGSPVASVASLGLVGRAAGRSAERRRDGGLVREVAVLLADRGHQAAPVHPVADRAADLAQTKLDPEPFELQRERGEHVDRRDVEVGGRPDVDDERPRRFGRRVDERHHLILRDIGVDERQRHVRSQDEEARHRLRRRVAVDVGEDRRLARDPPEDRDVRPAGLVEDRQQRQGDRDGHAGQRRREHDPTERRHRQQEIGPLPCPVALELADVHEVEDR